MKIKLILNYIASIVSLISTIIVIINGEILLSGLCGWVFGYLVAISVLYTIEYIEYKQMENKMFKYISLSYDKLIEQNKNSECENIFGDDYKNN